MNQKKRELSQNELVESLEGNYDKVKPYLPTIMLVCGLVVAAVIAFSFWRYLSRSANESSWREYVSSTRFNDARGYDFVATNFAGTVPGELAVLSAGDADYRNAMTSIIRNRSDYEDKLKTAANRFKQIVDDGSTSNKLLKLRATYALAYANEGLGKFNESKKLYQEIIEKAPGSPECELAEKGLVRVNDPKLTGIYEAFQQWQPATTAPDAPGSNYSLPDRPRLDWSDPAPEEAADGGAPASEADESAPDESAADEGEVAPATSDDKADNKMSDDKKADDKKVDDKKVDDKKVDDKKVDDKKVDDKKVDDKKVDDKKVDDKKVEDGGDEKETSDGDDESDDGN